MVINQSAPPILVEVYYRVCAPHLNPSSHSVEPQAPDRLALALNLMESAVDAVEGRLKSPTKKQGVICRTLLKALLMECFAWLPPNTFPGSSARLFKVLQLMHVLLCVHVVLEFYTRHMAWHDATWHGVL